MSTPHPAFRTAPGLSDWARRILAAPLYAKLATVNLDGSPHAVPVGFHFDGARILMPSRSGTRKVRNLEADPRARVLVEAAATITGIDDGWVAADGTAMIVRGAEGRELGLLAMERYLTDEGKRAFDEVFLPLMDATIVFVPQRWQTWDESGMHETMRRHGYTPDDAARWYR
jgi:nitroimidazol reductase NimA-like FMN-containing flavoprotein (pyridoxamine 5'-phosphate oxidase superfamily)